ncbi:MAG: PH domain-containing protein [Erythrobacter sp.]|nr:PH domain-containing protein [Erythrobacter sp.]
MSASVSVPRTGQRSNARGDVADASGEPQRTAPLSVVVGMLSSLQSAAFPAIAAAFGTGIAGPGVLIGIGVGLAIAVIGGLFNYIGWRRLTYTVGAEDIRVESGVFSRSARSVPYERIQDVSLEQKLLPRLLGLVAVKFETGAGGADDLALAFLSEAEGERLRELVRERRDDAESAAQTTAADAATSEEQGGETLFAMGPGRLFTFGLFEFSLAVFAVLAGLLQYLDTFFAIEVWDVDFWRDLAEEQGGWLMQLGAYGQVLSAAAGLVTVFLVGSATGLVRTFSREWGFVLERTARGFRRRRGLFTRTDVVMPIHRVQGLTISTGLLRYRFGWHGLKFVSLAQDAGSSSHVVAPFAKLEELDPVVRAAGFAMPSDAAEWHRATPAYRNVSLAGALAFFAVAAVIAGVVTWINAPDYTPLVLGGIAVVAALNAGVGLLSWRFKRHALDNEQIVAVAGILAPSTAIATRVKLHSLEIAQGPFARLFGYATLHLGMAGGEFAIPGIPIERAREVRAKVLQTIAATDFSQLESQRGAEIA